jgi:apolipoprotein N-acyltransferase
VSHRLATIAADFYAVTTTSAGRLRRFFVRATNTGVSAVVDPAGRIVAKLEPYRPASMVTEVRWMRGHTPYEVVGDAPWYLLRRCSRFFGGTGARGET